MGQRWPATGLGALSACMGPFERGLGYIHYLHHSLAREGTQPHPSTENWIKDLLIMALPIRIRPSFPSVSLSHQEASISFLSFSIRSEVKSLSLVRLFTTPRTIAYQASQSMGFSRQEYWSGLPGR